MATSHWMRIVAFAGLLACTATGCRASDAAGMKQFVPNLLPSVVSITTKSMQKPADAPESAAQAKAAGFDESFGTGFVVDPDGFIVTNRHVVDNAYDIIVSFHDGTRLSATLVGKGRHYDLALLKVTPITPLKAVRFGSSDGMQVGDPVLAIGNPFGLGIAVSAGIVSGLNRDLHFSHFDEFLQTDAAINHGNSGGPLFNERGEVIGINTALYSNNAGGGTVGIGYALPASDAQMLIPVLKRYGYLHVASLEVEPRAVTAALADALGIEPRGAIVATVARDGASSGILKVGDIILKVGETAIGVPRDLYRRVSGEIGNPLPVTIWRQGREMIVTLTPVQAPDEAGAPPIALPRPPAQASESMRLGAEVAPLTAENRGRFDIPADQAGILVTKVDPGTPAAAAGLSVGDVIQTVQMEPISSPADGSRLIDRAIAEKRRFIVSLVRGSKDTHFVTVPLQEP